MRKRIVPAISLDAALHDQWLDLEDMAEVHVSSEEQSHPIEAALLPDHGEGWRASEPGRQTIQIIFDSPQDLAQIRLVFVEERFSRTQEFALRWAATRDEARREIVRQQYNFTPVSSEVEVYTVNLRGVKILELEIVPAIQGEGHASLAELRLR